MEASLARYTDEERDVLMAAVEKYGNDEWELILTDPDYSGHLTNLTINQLRDKWKAIEYYSKTNNVKVNESEVAVLRWLISCPILFLNLRNGPTEH